MTTSQMCDSLECKVLRKFGKYTIEVDNKNRTVVTDGWLAAWVIFYGNGSWAWDNGLLPLRKDVREWLDKKAWTILDVC